MARYYSYLPTWLLDYILFTHPFRLWHATTAISQRGYLTIFFLFILHTVYSSFQIMASYYSYLPGCLSDYIFYTCIFSNKCKVIYLQPNMFIRLYILYCYPFRPWQGTIAISQRGYQTTYLSNGLDVINR